MRAASLPEQPLALPRAAARAARAGIGSHGCIIGADAAVGPADISFGMIQVPLRAKRNTASAPPRAISHANSQPVLPIPIHDHALAAHVVTGVSRSR